MSENKRTPVRLTQHYRSPGNGEYTSGTVAGFDDDEARALLASGIAVPYVTTDVTAIPVAHPDSPVLVTGEDALEAGPVAYTIRAEGTASPPTANEKTTPKKKKA